MDYSWQRITFCRTLNECISSTLSIIPTMMSTKGRKVHETYWECHLLEGRGENDISRMVES